jgi:archaeosine synthase beta-subunit
VDSAGNPLAEALRDPRNRVISSQPYAWLVESEPNRSGRIKQVGTVFLTNRECPFQCTMCDLWKNTLKHTVKAGEIPAQIEFAVARLPQFDSIKLYNSGNFFDPQAIPRSDYPRIAGLVRSYDETIVENHPKLTNQHCLRFAEMIAPCKLEVAIGLETCHPESLAWLNKQMTLADFERAVELLQLGNINSRVFLLLGLPMMSSDEYCQWTLRSIEHAADRGVDCFSIIPTRPTMPSLARLQLLGKYIRPTAATIEWVMEQALRLKRGRVFVDLWDAASFFTCPKCLQQRVDRLSAMNLQQSILPKVSCSDCDQA